MDLDHLLDLIKRHREMAVLASLSLQAGDTAIVAGAYKGDTMAFLRGLYGPLIRLVGYEPQSWAFDLLKDRFSNDRNVHLFRHGLGNADGRFEMGALGTDACFFREPLHVAKSQDGSGSMLRADRAFDALEVPRIALLVLNVEGYEHALLAYMADTKVSNKIDRVLVQFHGEGNGRRELALTHTMRWAAGNWQYWEL